MTRLALIALALTLFRNVFLTVAVVGSEAQSQEEPAAEAEALEATDDFDELAQLLRGRIKHFYAADNKPAPYKGEQIFAGKPLPASTYSSVGLQNDSVKLFERVNEALNKRDTKDDIEGFNNDLIAIVDRHHLLPVSAIAALHLAEFEYLIGNLNAAMSLSIYLVNAHRHSGAAPDAMLLLADIFYRYEYMKEAEEVLDRLSAWREGAAARRNKELKKMQSLKPTLGQNISFPDGGRGFGPELEKHLPSIAEILRQNPNWHLSIKVHADPSAGEPRVALALTERRANGLKNELVSQFGIPEGRITAKGFGSMAPVSSSRTKQGREQNNRVEMAFVVAPKPPKKTN